MLIQQIHLYKVNRYGAKLDVNYTRARNGIVRAKNIGAEVNFIFQARHPSNKEFDPGVFKYWLLREY
jgi:hypothetical protein